ncbi:MAG: SpoIIE family protein phosphatase [Acidobacteriota bacterium]
MVKRKPLLALSSVLAIVGFALWWQDIDLGLGGSLLQTFALACFIALFLWLLTRGLQRFLWRVGRRLAFSYFLIGVVPLPLLLLLVLVAAYIAGGSFLGHVYRDALASINNDLRFAAHREMEQVLRGNFAPIEHVVPVRFAYYRDGRKLTGAAEAPELWQSWWPSDSIDDLSAQLESLPLVAGADGTPTLAAAVREEPYSILAIFDGNLSRELSERGGIWVELFRADDPRNETMKITFGRREYPLEPPHFDSTRDDLRQFFHPGNDDPELFDRPIVTWVEVSEPFLDLATGERVAKYVSATLTATLRALHYHLVSRTSEVNLFVYLVFFGITLLLVNLGVIAALMALLLVLGLSRAVNHLSDATERVQQGDFAARIEVQRRDQIGALQTNFNRMAINLERLVATAAQKEILEKEISIARALQQSLLPDTLAAPSALRFATHFEPSTAIGGDYYDLLPMGDERLAVVIADVSGHGLSAGLRMAMVKSALTLLCEEENRPEEILKRLHHLLRHRLQSSGDRRGFVTATLALVDSSTGELVLTNAGHPPTYLLRQGEVTEVLLPGTPLGALGNDYGQTTLELVPGDLLVWLSDGLIEATSNGETEPSGDFGYERVVQTLTGLEPHPATVRDRLLEAVARHTGGGPPEDDRTLLVMAYRPDGGGDQDEGSSPSSE